MKIKNIASSGAASLSDSNEYVRIPRKKKSRTGVLRSNKYPNKAHNHHGIQRYFVLCKKARIPERKYMLHIAEECTGMRTNRILKYGMGGSVGSRTD